MYRKVEYKSIFLNKIKLHSRGLHLHTNLLTNILCFSNLTFILLLTFIFFPLVHITTDAEATITPSTTSLSLSTNIISTSLIPNNTSGTFVASDPSTISVTTNNYTGYTLGITSSNDTDNTKLVNTDDSSIYLTSISSASTPAEFTANSWGYLPSKLNSVVNTNYLPAPTTTATTLDATNAANVNANTYTISLGTKVDYLLPEGTYENTFTLTAIANPVTYSITYDKNTEDTVTNMPSTQSGTVENSDISLSSNIPTRTSYDFLGWCTITPTTTNGIDSCSGTTYQPGDIINTNKTAANTLNLKAMWHAKYTQTTRVRYEVAGADGTYGSYTIVDTQEVLSGSSYSWSTSQISDFDTNVYNSASVSSYTVTGAKTNSVSITRKAYTQTTRIRYEVANADGTYGSYTTVDTKSVKSGGTYSWSSSSISGFDTATYNSASVSSYTVTGAKTNSLNITRKSYTLTVSRNSTYISSVSGGGTYKVGKVVNISATAGTNYKFTKWTQTAGTTSSFGSTTTASTTFTMPASAATVYANGSIYYIQGVTTSLCPSSRTLVYDYRDSKGYYIQKIGSLCWMTSNLNIAGGTTLTSATSNVSSNYKLPSSSLSGFDSNTKANVYNSSNYGGYYNYISATAGTSPSSGNATYDICPKGWRLPTSANFNTLKASYTTGSALTSSPWYGSYSGDISDGEIYYAGSRGSYWASTAGSSTYAYYIYYDSSSVDMYNLDKRRGRPIRCVAK